MDIYLEDDDDNGGGDNGNRQSLPEVMSVCMTRSRNFYSKCSSECMFHTPLEDVSISFYVCLPIIMMAVTFTAK
jgi:hypothetical protein